MRTEVIRKIEQEIESIQSKYYKLILVCEHQRGNSVKIVAQNLKIPLLNINLLLSEQLKEFPSKRMAGKVHNLLSDILRNSGSSIICLDHIEILFNPILKQDVIQLLQSFSRNYTLVVSWRGSYDGKRFVYATPGHPEYYECRECDGIVIE